METTASVWRVSCNDSLRIAATIACTSIIRKAVRSISNGCAEPLSFNLIVELKLHPVAQETGKILELHNAPGYALKALLLDHSVPTIGYRLEEMERLHFLPEKLDQLGIHGPMVGELRRKGMVHISGRTVRLEEVTAPRRGSIFAFVMDTRPCAAAVALGKNADLLVMEATYTSDASRPGKRLCTLNSSRCCDDSLGCGRAPPGPGPFFPTLFKFRSTPLRGEGNIS